MRKMIMLLILQSAQTSTAPNSFLWPQRAIFFRQLPKHPLMLYIVFRFFAFFYLFYFLANKENEVIVSFFELSLVSEPITVTPVGGVHKVCTEE